jgi:hypothetical protein
MMNSRIELVSDSEVRLIGRSISGVYFDSSYFYVDKFQTGDRVAVEALRDCINAWLDTGSFAALADTSAVPFRGKRVKDRDGEVVTLDYSPRDLHPIRWCAHDDEGALTVCPIDEIHPLIAPEPLRPKYRPMTPAEAATHIGHSFKVPKSDVLRYIDGVYGSGVMTTSGQFNDFKQLVYECTWGETNTPCGIPERLKGEA